MDCLPILWEDRIAPTIILANVLALSFQWDPCDYCLAVVSQQWTVRNRETELPAVYAPLPFRFWQRTVFLCSTLLRCYVSALINKCDLRFWNSSPRAWVHIMFFSLTVQTLRYWALPRALLPEKNKNTIRARSLSDVIAWTRGDSTGEGHIFNWKTSPWNF